MTSVGLDATNQVFKRTRWDITSVKSPILIITVMGLAIRLAGARGDLWLDEIWSSQLAAQAPSLLDVLFALPYDNNHFLNTLWLKIAGPNVPSLITRLPAVLLGTLTIPVAALTGRRYGKPGAIIFALIFAFDYAFLDFETEARGYSGLILGVITAFYAIENVIGERGTARNLRLFALAICFGTFSHLIMVEPAGLLCGYAALAVLKRDGLRAKAIRRIAAILAAATIGIAPALFCVFVSLAPGVLHVGLITPFSFQGFATGLGDMALATFGFPADATNAAAAIFAVFVASAFLVIVWGCHLSREHLIFYALTIILLPVFHVALHIRNMEVARFHLTTGVALILLWAETLTIAWIKSGWSRTIAIAILFGFLTCQSVAAGRFIAIHRGNYHDAALLMSAHGPSTFLVLPEILQGETAAVIRWYAPQPKPLQAAGHMDCEHPADWAIESIPSPKAAAIRQVWTIKTGPCTWTYRFAATFPSYGLTGFTWLLYRSAP